jgi:hypothetical protein
MVKYKDHTLGCRGGRGRRDAAVILPVRGGTGGGPGPYFKSANAIWHCLPPCPTSLMALTYPAFWGTGEGVVDVMQLRYCLCGVARAVALDLGAALPSTFTTQLRRTLFDTLGAWCEEGASPGENPVTHQGVEEVH